MCRRPRRRAQGEESRRDANFSLRIEVPEVTVDVGVLLEKTHQFVPGLKPNQLPRLRGWRGAEGLRIQAR
jgi:hypothetical protein